MSDKHNEQLSALIDGAEVDERVLERMLRDDEQLSTWQRYQLAGAIVRSEIQPGMPLDISAAVADKVAHEPAIIAPRKRRWLKPAANDSWWRPAASFAVAASVALVTVIGVHNYQLPPNGEPAVNSAATSAERSTNPVFETSPIGGMASPVSFNAVQGQPATNSSDQDSAQRRQLQSFFIDHQQQSQLGQQQQSEPSAAPDEQSENGNQ